MEEKEKIVKLIHQNLKAEEEYEVNRSKNFENKAYIALVAITFLIAIPLAFIKNINLLKILNEIPWDKVDKFLNSPLKRISYIQLFFLIKTIFIVLNIAFFTLIFLSLLNFLKVMDCIEISRVGLKYYSYDALVKSSKILYYTKNINKLLIISIEKRELALKAKIKSYNKGLKYLKKSVTVLILIILLKIMIGE